MNILVLVDLGEAPPEDQDFSRWLKTDDWRAERHVVENLRELGHDAKLFGIYNSIEPLLEELTSHRPDLVFNLCEAFDGDRRFEPHLIALLDLLRIPFTGASLESLSLCKDKGLTKKILSYHRIKVPHFVVSHLNHPLRSLKSFQFPAFIKPLGLEASEGIAQLSFVDNEKDALSRIAFLHERFKCDVIIEEYIEGREIYVGVIGNGKLIALPPRELFFKHVPEGEARFATFKAKWDEAYRKRWGIRTGKATSLEERLEKNLLETCKKIYRLFGMRGYARLDFRLRPNGDFVFIEANPNPSIAKDEDFALAAAQAGLPYPELIRKVVNLSI